MWPCCILLLHTCIFTRTTPDITLITGIPAACNELSISYPQLEYIPVVMQGKYNMENPKDCLSANYQFTSKPSTGIRPPGWLL